MKQTWLIGVLVLWVSSANAHITIEPKAAPAGEYSKLTFRVPHGCEGSPTIKITVQLPEGVLSVKPQVHTGWKIETKKVKLNEPVKLHGVDVMESISEVTWKGGALADEYMDEFGISLKLPNHPGQQLAFPVIQECKRGVSRWVEISNSDHAGHGSKFPAPTLLLNKVDATEVGSGGRK